MKSLILALLAIAAISTAGLAQTTNTSADGVWLYTVNESNEATLVGITEYGIDECNLKLVDAWGTGYFGYLEIPATLGVYPLTGIGADAFYNLATSVPPGRYVSHINSTNSTWHTLFLPAVKRLEANALRYIPCRYVEFWSDTLSIGSNAFAFNPNLDTVWANNVTDIGFEGFFTCYEFRGFRDTPTGKWQGPIPSTVKSIGKNAFLQAKLEKQVSIPASLESVGYSAFQLSGVERLIIPSGVTCITYGAIQSSQIADALYLGNRPNIYDSDINIYRLPGTTGWPPRCGVSTRCSWLG